MQKRLAKVKASTLIVDLLSLGTPGVPAHGWSKPFVYSRQERHAIFNTPLNAWLVVVNPTNLPRPGKKKI